MRLFQLNEPVGAKRDLFIQMVDAFDHLTPKTGLSPNVAIVKAGGASYAAAAGTATEISNGTYRLRLGIADLDTEGEAMLKITADGAGDQFIPLWIARLTKEVHQIKAALLNKRLHTIDTGVNVIKDDDDATTLATLTPSESDGVITIQPS